MSNRRNSNHKNSMYMRGIVHDIISNLWMVIMSILIVEMATFIYANVLHQKKYESTVVYNVQLCQKPVTAYNSTVMSGVMAKQMKSALENGIIQRQLSEKFPSIKINEVLSIENIENTNILKIIVRANTPELSFKILKEFMKEKDTISDTVFDNGELIQLEDPEISVTPINQFDYMTNMLIAGVCTIIIMIAMIAGMSYLKNTVKNEIDIIEKLDTDLIATIYKEQLPLKMRGIFKKKKVGILISNNVISNMYEESINKIRVKLEYLAAEKDYKKFLISSMGENEGKSTVAANVAIALAQKDYKVLLIDVDLKKPAIYKLLELNIDREKDWVYAVEENRVEDSLYYIKNLNLNVMCMGERHGDSAAFLSSDGFKALLDQYSEKMDFIILDSSPMFAAVDTEIISQSVDATMLVVRQDLADTNDISECLDILEERNSEFIGCIFNNVARTKVINGKKNKY